jgi:hypothetical protein
VLNPLAKRTQCGEERRNQEELYARRYTKPDQGPAVINFSRTKASVVATPIVRMAMIAKKMCPRQM